MQVAKGAAAYAAALPPKVPRMLYLNIGEPDFAVPAAVQTAADAAIRAGLTPYTPRWGLRHHRLLEDHRIRAGLTPYTPALGLQALRERLSEWYA